MSLTRDMQELMNRVKRTPGFTVALTKGGHWQVRDQNERLLVVAASTPSDWRAVKNTVNDLRKAGVPLEGKTKYDSRPNPDDGKDPRYSSDLPESQQRLIANINSYLAEQGFDPNAKQNKSRREFVDAMMRVTLEKGMRGPISRASADQSLTRLLRHGGKLTAWMEALMAETLETLWAEKQAAEDAASAAEVHGQEAAEAAEAEARAEAEHRERVEALRPEPDQEATPSPMLQQVTSTEANANVVYTPSPEKGEVAEEAVDAPVESNGHMALPPEDQLDLLLRLTTALAGAQLATEETLALVKEVRAQMK